MLAAGALALAAPVLPAQAQDANQLQAPAQARQGNAAESSLAVTQLSGSWEMLVRGGARRCRIILRPTEIKGGHAVGFPVACRRNLPVLARVAAWSVSDDGYVRLGDADGAVLLAFADDEAPFRLQASADGVDYQLDSLGRPRRYLARTPAVATARVPFDPATAPPRETLPGEYALVRNGGQEVCRITLGTQPGSADGRFLTSFPQRCRDRGLQVFDAVAWRYSGGRIHIIARRGHEMSMIPTGAGQWQKDPPGGSALGLRKISP